MVVIVSDDVVVDGIVDVALQNSALQVSSIGEQVGQFGLQGQPI